MKRFIAVLIHFFSLSIFCLMLMSTAIEYYRGNIGSAEILLMGIFLGVVLVSTSGQLLQSELTFKKLFFAYGISFFFYSFFNFLKRYYCDFLKFYFHPFIAVFCFMISLYITVNFIKYTLPNIGAKMDYEFRRSKELRGKNNS